MTTNFMKYLISGFIIFAVLFFSTSCEDNEDNKLEKINFTGKPQIEFLKTSHDFGTLKEGEIVECVFKFKNTGEAPLAIIYVNADCGCTVPEFSKNEILPGEEGKIKVIFDSSGFRNNIYKTIDVETNADSTIIELVLTAFIEHNNNL